MSNKFALLLFNFIFISVLSSCESALEKQQRLDLEEQQRIEIKEQREKIAAEKAFKIEQERIDKEIEIKRIEREIEIKRIEREKQAELAKQKAEEEAKRKKLDALIGGINDSEGATTGGQGDDNVAGDKGKITGDPNADGFYGNGGAGGGGDYQLGNRKRLSRPKPKYICNEEGLVIVRIEVDINGRVTKASAGVKGSTNTAECLLSQAQEAAMKTKWQADSKAPSKQTGTIKYRFSLSQ